MSPPLAFAKCTDVLQKLMPRFVVSAWERLLKFQRLRLWPFLIAHRGEQLFVNR